MLTQEIVSFITVLVARRNVSGGCGVSRVGDEGGRKAAR